MSSDRLPRWPFSHAMYCSLSSEGFQYSCLRLSRRVWNVPIAECVRKHTFHTPVGCVSFIPTKEALIVTSRRDLFLWHYKEPTPDDNVFTRTSPERENGEHDIIPVPNDADAHPLIRKHLLIRLLRVDNLVSGIGLHHCGHMLMTSEKYRIEPQESSDVQLTLRLVVHRFDWCLGGRSMEPIWCFRVVLPTVMLSIERQHSRIAVRCLQLAYRWLLTLKSES